MEDLTSAGGPGNKRVRKKSAKVREMEEASAFERKIFKSPPKSSGASGTSSSVKKNRTKQAKDLDANVENIQTSYPERVPVVPDLAQLTDEPSDETAQLLLNIRAMATVKSEEQTPPIKKPKKSKKKSKTPVEKKLTGELIQPSTAVQNQHDQHVNLSYDNYSSITVKQEDDSGLKLKLCLNSPSEQPEDLIDFKSDDEQPAIWPSHPSIPPVSEQVLLKAKKKKHKKHKTNGFMNGDSLSLDLKTSPVDSEPGVLPDPSNLKIENSLVSPKLEFPEVDLKMEAEEARSPSPLSPVSNTHLDGQLVIDTTSAKPEQGKSGKRKRKRKTHPDMEGFQKKHAKAAKHQDIDQDTETVSPVSLYSNTAAMALKLKTSSEKRFSGITKDRNKNRKNKKKFRRNGPTAYTMFCNNYRSKVIAENPGSDFIQTSKRLGEIWQCLPAKEKMFWKRKARQTLKRMHKETDFKPPYKLEGEDPPPHPGDLKRPPPIYHSLGAKTTMQRQKQNKLHRGGKKTKKSPKPKVKDEEEEDLGSSSLLGQLLTSHTSEEQPSTSAKPMSPPPQPRHSINLKADPTTPCRPIDVAAHLKLLGDSLTTIGNRLQDQRIPIAVQGSLSVFLDSSICAMAALMSLTNQVPELKTTSPSVHSKNLDNIAYIMPGIG